MADVKVTADISDIVEAANHVRQFRTEIGSMATSARRTAGPMSQFNLQANALGRNMNRTGVITQQAGYQIGDFIVQVQSGTNAFVAFGQQATQVAGTLTLLQGKWIAIGSALGVAIPLLTALGAAWMRTRRQVSETIDPLERVSQELESLERVDFNLGREFRAVSDEAERFLGLLRDIRQEAAASAVRDAITNLTSSLGSAAQQRSITSGIIGGYLPATTSTDARAGGSPYQQFLSDQEVQNIQEVQRILQGVSGTTAPALAQSLSEATEELRRQGLLTDDLRAAINGMVNELGLEEHLYEDITGQLEHQNQLYEDRLETLLEAGRIAQEGYDTRQEMVAELENEIALYTLMAQFGEDSVAVERLRAEQARETFRARVAETTTNQVLIDQVMRYYDAMVHTREESEEVARVLSEIAGVSTDSVEQQILNIAEALNISTAAAIALRQSMPGASDGGVSGPDAANAATQEGFGSSSWILSRRVYRGRSGGGGDSGQSLSEIIAEREQQIAQELEVARLTGENARIREIQIELENAYGQEVNETQRAAIEASAQTILAREQELEQLEQLRADQESLSNTIESSMTDAFMAIADGTMSASEAFKRMAAQIIEELFRILVVQQMVAQFTGSLGGLGGGGGLLGALFSRRASGGTMNPGAPYLVGERGPEIVIPGRQSTVMNNNLSSDMANSGERVVINQTFSFAANGDESVKRIIAAEAPKIAALTQKQIVDQRRRGGQMRSTFG